VVHAAPAAAISKPYVAMSVTKLPEGAAVGINQAGDQAIKQQNNKA